ncbi:hypothetical protein [Frigidibacter sp. MR17.24]|uniref:hypothetical protein n=1 Tax=Frigidibacter sp. MR17.24 TaxID=3127345 RepID=UPI003013019A
MPRYRVTFQIAHRPGTEQVRKDIYAAALVLSDQGWQMQTPTSVTFESDFDIDLIAEVMRDQIRLDLDTVTIRSSELEMRRIVGRRDDLGEAVGAAVIRVV